MKKTGLHIAHSILALTLLSGCDAFNVFLDPDKSQQGASQIDLVALIAPDLAQSEVENSDARLIKAYGRFYAGSAGKNLRLLRNRVQDAVIASSNLRCAEYKLNVRKFDKNANFSLGFITTLSSGLGAIFDHERTVRTLSGVSAISSGTRSQFNDVFIKESTKQLFTLAFEERRKKLLNSMRNRKAEEIDDYTLESAIGDAIRYHDACSIVAGLEELSSNYPSPEDKQKKN